VYKEDENKSKEDENKCKEDENKCKEDENKCKEDENKYEDQLPEILRCFFRMDIYGTELMRKARTFDRVWNWHGQMRISFPKEYEKVCKQYATGDFDPTDKEIERYTTLWLHSHIDLAEPRVGFLSLIETEEERLEGKKDSVKKIYIIYMYIRSRQCESTVNSDYAKIFRSSMCDYPTYVQEHIRSRYNANENKYLHHYQENCVPLLNRHQMMIQKIN
jgi:hypothetical protein